MLALLSATACAADLRIAAWNLELLKDTDLEGCIPREESDYAAIARQVEALDADIVAIQEVENEAAARRVFPPPEWQVEVSTRPIRDSNRTCRERPEALLGRLATGFAIRRGIPYRRDADLSALGGGSPFDRWGTDIAVTDGERELRLLIPFFNPASNGTQQSWLRLINPGEKAATIAIEALDDRGEPPPEGGIRLTLPTGSSRMFTARQLERGAEEFSGRLGDGEGKWQLFVSADHPVQVMSLLQSPTGNLTNLSR